MMRGYAGRKGFGKRPTRSRNSERIVLAAKMLGLMWIKEPIRRLIDKGATALVRVRRKDI
jgi:hypothetical protein